MSIKLCGTRIKDPIYCDRCYDSVVSGLRTENNKLKKRVEKLKEKADLWEERFKDLLNGQNSLD